MFWKVEGRTGLYVFFKTVCDVYGLIPEDNYTIPAQAEGIEPPPETRSSIPPLILKREPVESGPYNSDTATTIGGLTDHSLSSATTKRHRHSPSIGATPVQTVVEENEEEEERTISQSMPATDNLEATEEDEESESEITVIEDSEYDDADVDLDENATVDESSAVAETAQPSHTQSTDDESSPEAEVSEESVTGDTDTETVEPTKESTKTDNHEEDSSSAEEVEPEATEKPDESSLLVTPDDKAGVEKS